jgi:hypothetical protein
MVERLNSAAVVGDVVCGPQRPERVATLGQLVDQFRKLSVGWMASGFSAQTADGVVGDAIPVAVEPGRAGDRDDESKDSSIDPTAGD